MGLAHMAKHDIVPLRGLVMMTCGHAFRTPFKMRVVTMEII